MNAQQIALALVLSTMVFSIALELKIQDFKRVAQTPKAVVAAMILAASCPGGSLSNMITHFGRGNTAISVSASAVAALIALVATPFNFAWMVSSNPVTAA